MPFDIRTAVAEIPQSETEYEKPTVAFTFDLKLAHRLKELRAAEDLDEGAIAATEAQLAERTYVADLQSVPRRRRQDLVTEALDKYSARPSAFGQPDQKAEFLRGQFIRLETVIAAVKAVHAPDGNVNDTEDSVRATIEYIHDEAPDQIFDVIERAVQELNDKEDEQDALQKTADF